MRMTNGEASVWVESSHVIGTEKRNKLAVGTLHYQEAIRDLAVYPGAGTGNSEALYYTALGLASEAGEVAGKVKKLLRDDHGALTPTRREAIIDELGDVAWYITRLAAELDSALDLVLLGNLVKLYGRQASNTLHGDGDVR